MDYPVDFHSNTLNGYTVCFFGDEADCLKMWASPSLSDTDFGVSALGHYLIPWMQS